MSGSIARVVVRTLVAAGVLMASSGPVTAQPLIRILEVYNYYGSVSGQLVPKQGCDDKGDGCLPDFLNTVYFSNSMSNGGLTGPAAEQGTEDDGNTDGGLKETSVVGTYSISLSSVNWYQDFGVPVSRVTASAFVGASLSVRPDLHSAFVGGGSSLSSIIRLRGLPNDQFFHANFGSPAELSPTDAYGRPGVRYSGNLVGAGDFTFSVYTNSISYSYLCPTCVDPWNPNNPNNPSDDFDIGAAFSVQTTADFRRISGATNWLQTGEGMDRRAWAFLPLGDERIVVGGTFDAIGGEPVNKIATWDGETWAPMGTGMNGGVRALVEFNGGIVAGGGFTTADGAPAEHVAFWNGSQWLPMGQGLNRVVRALFVLDGTLYAGGNFIPTAQQPFASLARWDPAAQDWVGVLESIDGPVYALTGVVLGNEKRLVFGGEFSDVDGSSARNLGEYYITPLWTFATGLNGGVNGPVNALVMGKIVGDFSVQRDAVYIGGSFDRVSWFDAPASNTALYDLGAGSTEIRPLVPGVNGPVNTLYMHDPGPDQTLIVGGEFTQAGTIPAARIARYDLGHWGAMGDGFNEFVGAVSMFRGEVFATGEFTQTGSRSASHIARWTLDAVCPGDTNGDLTVNFEDLNIVLGSYNTSGGVTNPADLNNDGVVNFADLNVVLGAFNNVCQN